MLFNPFNTKVGLALGGGAAKGIAHIGVLRAIEEKAINIHCISGTSIGALIGAYYAFGKTPTEIEKLIPELNFRKVMKLTLPRKGFISTERIEEMVLRDIGPVNIEDARIPLAIMTTDIRTGEAIVLDRGPLYKAVCASVSVPGIFIPTEYRGRVLVDGGLTENVPISPLEDMGAGVTVAVDLNGVKKYPAPDDIVTILGNAMDIAIDIRTKEQLKEADVVISMDLSAFTRLDNSHVFEDILDIGYETASKQIEKLIWYRKTGLYQFFKKLFFQLQPLKIPKLFQRK